ncbi:MAG: DegV family protein [Lachnospiraceae bacterium]|nr:DegV family protein [Lachnospiraceae bacterium]
MYEGRIEKLEITPMGSVIGTHVGTGAIGVVFFSEKG